MTTGTTARTLALLACATTTALSLTACIPMPNSKKSCDVTFPVDSPERLGSGPAFVTAAARRAADKSRLTSVDEIAADAHWRRDFDQMIVLAANTARRAQNIMEISYPEQNICFTGTPSVGGPDGVAYLFLRDGQPIQYVGLTDKGPIEDLRNDQGFDGPIARGQALIPLNGTLVALDKRPPPR
ncbi:hypothetical protein HUN08_06990 [Gordonia sp. X0973]|uniref:hypothetical protein n=1 Tax=Gordonia sp. X0973 TaxID=2742602 RepID=UPI000F524D12|nr:hypothetical protein [Gordonia sp. X0973]QKT06964.1 hypothetical protein HUN08_06990 [Gordonia sp. X0973]